MDRHALDLSDLISIATPNKELDLSQAASLHDAAGFNVENNPMMPGRASSSATDLNIVRIRKMLEEVINGLTDATQKTFESQTQYFDTTIKEFMNSVQEALNDIDGRLNALSQAQSRSEDVLDALIKVLLLNGREGLDTSEQQAIIQAFIARGLPPQSPANAVNPEGQ